jgi:hypothetical protein
LECWRKNKGLSIPNGWRNSGGRYIDLECSVIRTAPVPLLRFDGASWIGYYERGMILHRLILKDLLSLH